MMPVLRRGDVVRTGVTLTCTGCNKEMEAYNVHMKVTRLSHVHTAVHQVQCALNMDYMYTLM